MATFTAARTSEFAALLAMYGTTIDVAGETYPAIAPPAEIAKVVTPGAFNANRTLTVQMWRVDPSGLHKDFVTAFTDAATAQRKPFQVGGYTFEVKSVNDDPVEPSVEIRAGLRQ